MIRLRTTADAFRTHVAMVARAAAVSAAGGMLQRGDSALASGPSRAYCRHAANGNVRGLAAGEGLKELCPFLCCSAC